MNKKKEMKTAIQSVIHELMERVMEKVLVKDPFDEEEHKKKKPLYAALVPDEIFKGAHFERRFVTPFGNVWEKLAIVAAKKGLGFGEKGFVITGKINTERLRRIQEVLNNLEHSDGNKKKIRPDWNKELEYVLQGTSKDFVSSTVICDVFAKNTKTGKKYAFELKAPLPNSDQTKVSKEKILKLYSMEPCQIDGAYYALPYNPYGKKKDYSWAFPARWFDMRNDEVVLIGNEFWEKIGGAGTYEAFIEAIDEIGGDYKKRIYREYLGIDPDKV